MDSGRIPRTSRLHCQQRSNHVEYVLKATHACLMTALRSSRVLASEHWTKRWSGKQRLSRGRHENCPTWAGNTISPVVIEYHIHLECEGLYDQWKSTRCRPCSSDLSFSYKAGKFQDPKNVGMWNNRKQAQYWYWGCVTLKRTHLRSTVWIDDSQARSGR